MDTCTGITKVADGVGEIVAGLVKDVKRLLGSTDGLDTTLRFWADSKALVGIMRSTHDAAIPFFQVIGIARSVVSVSRLCWSLNECIGSPTEDPTKKLEKSSLAKAIEEGNTASIVAAVSFLVARTLSTVKWCMEIGLFQAEEIARHASKIGTFSVFSRFATHPAAIAFKNAPLIDATFLVALTALGVMNGIGLYKREKVGQNLFEIISVSADIALCTLGLVGKAGPFAAAALGTVAAGTGIVAFYFDPANNTNS